MKICSSCGRESRDSANVCCGRLLELVKPTDQPTDPVATTIAERGKVYGDPYLSHANIGLSWTALIQQHYGVELSHPIPPALVAQMMVVFKMNRAARVFHADNYLDAHAYVRFADDFQQRAPITNE